jgi:hypothetical protein
VARLSSPTRLFRLRLAFLGVLQPSLETCRVGRSPDVCAWKGYWRTPGPLAHYLPPAGKIPPSELFPTFRHSYLIVRPRMRPLQNLKDHITSGCNTTKTIWHVRPNRSRIIAYSKLLALCGPLRSAWLPISWRFGRLCPRICWPAAPSCVDSGPVRVGAPTMP